MEDIGYKIVLEFDSFSKVGFFLQDFENWVEYKAKRSERRETDQRGLQTKILHQRARAFQLIHPLIPYRECFKLANARS
jgi:hypothetical protein